MSLEIDLNYQLQFIAGPGVVVEQNKISTTDTYPAVFFQRSASQQELMLDGSKGLSDQNFNVEVYGLDIDAVECLANDLSTNLHGFRGKMGSTEVLAAFVSDSAEDYVSKVAMNTDEGIHVSTFSLQILS